MADRDRARIVDAHRVAQRELSQLLGRQLHGELERLPDVGDTSRDRYVAAAVVRITAAQHRAAALSAGFVRSLAPSRAIEVAPDLRLGEVAVSVLTPWIDSPIVRARARLAEGLTYADAIRAAGSYAGGLASVDMQRAVELGMTRGAEATRLPVGGWQKDLDGNACDWCVLVSDRLYSSPDAVPTHDRDRCSASPVFE